jgi:hypothetical protein
MECGVPNQLELDGSGGVQMEPVHLYLFILWENEPTFFAQQQVATLHQFSPFRADSVIGHVHGRPLAYHLCLSVSYGMSTTVQSYSSAEAASTTGHLNLESA